MMNYPEKCLRGHTDCQPLAQIEADDHSTFLCCGERLNKPEERAVPQDCFTLCVKSKEGVDDLRWLDRYDITSHMYVLSRALLMNDLKST